MKKILFTLSIVSSSIFMSCDSWLDLTPKDFLSPDQYYNNEKELQTALTGVYATFLRPGTYMQNFGRMGLDADESWNYREIGSVSNYATSPNDDKIQNYWRDYYDGISRANKLLENVDVPPMDENRRRVIKGETLFLRSFFYFSLVTYFGDIPLVLNSIETAALDELRPKRTSARLVYEQMIQDLEQAADLVEDIDAIGNSARVSKSAVYGLLARVNLYMAGYPLRDHSRYGEVIKWTDKIMSNSIHKLNPNFQNVFEKLARDEYDIGESIFEIEFSGNGIGIYATQGGVIGVRNGIQNNVDSVKGIAYTYLQTTHYAYNVYEEEDLRRDWTIAPFRYDNNFPANEIPWTDWGWNRYFQKEIGKFRRVSETLMPKHRNRTPQNFPIIRFSDILLMRAEAENEINKGPNDMAYDCINKVRRRGYGLAIDDESNIDFKDLDYERFLKQIQEERTRELAFENMRKADLVRWGIFIEKMDESYRHSLSAPSWSALPRAQEYFLNAKSSIRNVLWPIPSNEISVNPNLTQNPGY